MIILLRPEHKNELEKRLKNGFGARSGYLFQGDPPEGWVLVNEGSIPAYEKQGDKRNNVSLISFRSESVFNKES